MKEHRIITIEPGSIAEEMEIEPGDVLVSIDGNEIDDIFDYRMACRKEFLTVLIRKSGDGAADKHGEAEEWELEIEKDPCEDLGFGFDSGLMDRYRSCRNGCIFCFIDQMPEGMRETLYFKDDDARLSFLQGNYVTLTNMTGREIDRILEYHLSPINVSFHTTNPELRCRMLRNPKAGEALLQAKRLSAEGTGIELNGQIVLCKGINDGAELDRSLRDLFTDYSPGLQSVSVVPVGITKHRKGLYPLEPFTPEDARDVLERIHAFQEEALRKRGTRFVYAGDEWYLLSAGGRPGETAAASATDRQRRTDRPDRMLPPAEAYEGYPQLENGVGMTRLLIEEFRDALRLLRGKTRRRNDGMDHARTEISQFKYEISIATGTLIAPVLEMLLSEAKALAPDLTVHLYPVRNDFFGPSITVSGLLTGCDIIRRLRGKPAGKKLILPANLLRAGETVLLDDVTLADISEALGVPVEARGPSGYDLVSALFDLADGALNGETGEDHHGGTGYNPYELPETGG